MITFKIFGNYDEALEIFNVLDGYKIPVELEDSSERFNPSFTSTPFSKEFRIRIEQVDFEKAIVFLRNYFQIEIKNVEADYYLYAFSENELKEILIKPEEWDFFDYFLAEKLLQEKGIDLNSEELQKEKEQRLKQISKPGKRAVFLIVFGYIFSIFIAFIGLLFGWLLFHSKKTLYTGEKVFTYRKSDRTHGYIIFTIAVISLFIYTLRFLLII